MGMALDTDSNNLQNSKPRDIVVYIVQRSWYAGPQTSPPVDYRRLLLSRTSADQVAYHSAHQWAARQSASTTVRTLQLPDGSFGFLAANHLFWVRSVTAQATVDITDCNRQHFDEAHCIMSPDGTLLGGTHPRRAALSTEPHCMFVGPQSSHAALQWLMTQQHEHEQKRTMRWVPVGPPPTPHDITVEWPEKTTKYTTATTTTSSKRRCAEDDHDDTKAACLWYGRGSDSNYQNASCKRQAGQMRRPISFVDGEVTTPIMSNNDNNTMSSGTEIQMMMLE